MTEAAVPRLTTTRRIVALRALGLGDLCVAVPALRALRRGFPAAELALAAPRALEPILPLIGGIDCLVPVHGIDAPLPASLASCWLGVNLHGKGPESTRRLA